MTGVVRIRNKVDAGFGIVPRDLWRMAISANAKVAAAYLCCLRDDQAVPMVAVIERATGLSRDARRRAFGELERVGVVRWHHVRDASGRIVANVLEVDHAAIRPTENQAVGKIREIGSSDDRPPENPASGESVDELTGNRPSSDGISGDLLRDKKRESAARARAAAKARLDAESGFDGLAEFGHWSNVQRGLLRGGLTVEVRGQRLVAGSADHVRAMARLRAFEAGAADGGR
jgi:hypothetical protein